MKTPKFSIIIPVYNVEKYLKTCINSILEQTYSNYELILVNDGTLDNSGNICDEYAQKSSNIRVIHKNNGGLSSARNAGIDVASGKYIIFLDGYDFWDDKQALKNIEKQLEESDADLLIFSAKRYYEHQKKYTLIISMDVERDKITSNNSNTAIQYLLENNIYRAAAWNKVIRKSLIDAHKMRFKEGYLSEDMDWCGDLLLYANKFDYYSNALYAYRQQRSGSITQNNTEKLVADKLYMCRKGYKQAENLKDREKGWLLTSYYAYEYAVSLGVSSGIKNKEILQDLKDMQFLLEFDICNKVKKVKRLKKLLGYTLTRKILGFFVKIKR